MVFRSKVKCSPSVTLILSFITGYYRLVLGYFRSISICQCCFMSDDTTLQCILFYNIGLYFWYIEFSYFLLAVACREDCLHDIQTRRCQQCQVVKCANSPQTSAFTTTAVKDHEMQHALTSWSQLSSDTKYDKYQNAPPCLKQNSKEINTSSTVHSL